MLSRLKIIFSFYRRFLWISLILNIILLSLDLFLAVIFWYKIFLGLVLFFWYKMSDHRQRLVFYQNLGIGTIFLFGICIFLDMLLLFACALIFRIIL